MPTAYYMVHYRRFRVDGGKAPGKLENMCRTSLGMADRHGVALWERVNDRICRIPGEPAGRQVVLNKVADLHSAIFGEMCLVDPKGLQALLELSASKVELSDLTTAEVYDLQEKTAPRGSQFIRGLAYWLAIGDHVFFVKTNSMTSALLLHYIDWLLRNGVQPFPSGITLELQAEFDPSQLAGDVGDIKQFRVRGNAAPRMAIRAVPDQDDGDGEREVSTSRRIADKAVQFAEAIPVVQALLGKGRAKSLVDSLGPEEYLTVDASVKVRGRRTEKSRRQMKKIASELADNTDGEVLVEGKDGKVSDGDAILRTRMPFDLPHDGASVLDFNNVADQLQEVYARFVHDGKIKA